MPKKVAKKNWLFIVLFLVLYGGLYIVLRNKILFTPDLSASDAFHFNASLKYYLWKSIRAGIVPFWTDQLQSGFPLLAEGQIGALFLPHYLIFPFFSSFPHAYMFLFAFHLFLLSIGMFALFSLFAIPPLLSFLLALTFTWNGSIVFRWVHFNLLQTFSLAPFLFWSFLKWNRTEHKKYALLIACLICEMIFAGHTQTVFIVLLGLTFTYICLNWQIRLKKTLTFFLIIICGFLFAAPQILPTLQLSSYSGRPLANSYDYATSVPFKAQNICGFFSLTCNGYAKDGTYSLDWSTHGIYWENTPYIGGIFIAVILVSTLYALLFLKKRSTPPLPLVFLSLFFIFLLLALGNDSPLYFLFCIFPFNLFRTPPKYLLMGVFFLFLYSAFLLKRVLKKNNIATIVCSLCLIVNCFFLIRTAFQYHYFVDGQKLIDAIQENKSTTSPSLYVTVGVEKQWEDLYSLGGWKNQAIQDTYRFLGLGLLPNSNLFTNLSSFDYNSGGLRIRRVDYLSDIVQYNLAQILSNPSDSSASARATHILDLYAINTIISAKPLEIADFAQVKSKTFQNKSLLFYKNAKQSSSFFYIPQEIHSVTYIEDVENRLDDNTLSPDNTVVESLGKDMNQKNTNSVTEITSKDQYLSGKISTDRDIFVVARKNWYPEWNVFIDGKKVTAYKTNIIHVGFIVPKGTHTIEVVYIPYSFYIGCVCALMGVGVFLLIKKNRE